MAKYTTTIEEYIQGRIFAAKLQDALDNDQLPDDPASLWIEAVQELQADPSIGYDIVKSELFPSPAIFYTNDVPTYENFIATWTDKLFFNEIGQETVGRFKVTLRGWLRDNMGYYTALYNSKISALSALASDYQRQTHDSLEKLGSEQNQRQHGESISYTPTNKGVKNYIIPLGGSTETELNQTQETGSDTTAHSGTDTDTLSFTNRVDTRWITENITGATGKDKAELIKMYRELIIDINTLIINQMLKDGLFMEVW